MNKAQKITIGVTLLLMSIITLNEWGYEFSFMSELVGLLLLGASFFAFFSLKKK